MEQGDMVRSNFHQTLFCQLLQAFCPVLSVLSETSGGETTRYVYDNRGNVIETIDPNGSKTKTEYDGNNRLTKMIEADGSISLFSYNKTGQRTRADYGNGLFVNYAYTATSPDWTVIEGPTIGRIERKFTADGKLGGWVTPEGEITFTYDAVGRLWREKQPNGQITEYTYDAAGRAIQTKDLTTGATSSKTYNIGGQLLTETDSLGRTTSYTYDRNGKVASTTNGLGQTYTYVYAGSKTTVIDPLGRKTTSVNNEYYLPTETIYSNGAKSSIEYLYTNNLQEAKDYPTRVIDIAGRVRNYGYDNDGNLITTTDLAGNTYNYTYGENGVSSITSPIGAKINYEYDDKGNLVKMSYGSQLGKQYGYDADGRLTIVTNASGSSITNVYNDKGQVVGQVLRDPNGAVHNIGTTYDTKGNVTTLTNNTGVTSYQYDSNGYVSQMISANGSSISYVRDIQGRIVSQTEKANVNAIGLTTSYTYDLYGKVLTVTDSRNRITAMTYDVVNRLATKTLPNGVKTTYGYDELDRITSIVYSKADGTVLASETYTRNIGGEPSKVLREDGSYTLYEYDAAVRLSKEMFYAGGALVRSISYSYDLDGKRTRKVDSFGTYNYGYNANGQLETVGQNQSYIYDADGRLNQFTRDGRNVSLSHDGLDHLTQVDVNGTAVQYLYDAQGNRIREISGTGVKNYLVAPNLGNGLESTDLVTDGSGNVVSDYVYGGSNIIARLDANGNPVYYLTDSMGSVIGLVDEQGNVISRIIYDGFGNVQSGDDGSSQGGDFRFQGQWLESESGLYYMRARDYDSQTGLFLSRDPVDIREQSVEAFNPYQFAYSNSLIYSDPTGMVTLGELNATLDVQNTLQRLKLYSFNQVRQSAFDKAKGIAGDVVKSLFDSVLPYDSLVSSQKFNYVTGGAFADIVRNSICNVIGSSYAPFYNNLHFETEINPNGNPLSNGFNCGPLPDDSYYLKYGSKLPNGKPSPRPDLVVKAGNPMDTDRKPPAYLILEIKRSLTEALSKSKGKGGQWDAMMNYAQSVSSYNIKSRSRGHQYIPIAMIVTLFDENKPGEREKLIKNALDAGVILGVVSLLPGGKGRG
jgi:RHS repeat-associated protein